MKVDRIRQSVEHLPLLLQQRLLQESPDIPMSISPRLPSRDIAIIPAERCGAWPEQGRKSPFLPPHPAWAALYDSTLAFCIPLFTTMKIRPAKLARLILLCIAWAATLLWQPAQAASVSTSAAAAAPVDQTRLMRWLRSQPALPHGKQVQVAVELKPDNRRTRLIACGKSEFFLPRGARLRGRVNVGERCVAGATWTRWHNVFVRVHGPALVSRRALQAGSAPQAADFRVEQVEWSALQDDPASVNTVLAGQQLVRALAANQPLRTDHLRPMPAIRSGEAVTAIADGEGFRIAVDATALSDASDGQPIRVRTASGKVLNGMVSGRTVTIGR